MRALGPFGAIFGGGSGLSFRGGGSKMPQGGGSLRDPSGGGRPFWSPPMPTYVQVPYDIVLMLLGCLYTTV